ncbi:hypothetical protein FHR78_002458 [Frigoribacterium faeni]|nr:hypothetical protein [Frigoribacterium faeni]NIJ05904.1 hypothetical protein [Frigoribacterium faeni]
MLTPEALAEAAHSKRFRLESGLQFTGIFIPSDIAWSKQLQTYSKWNLPAELSSEIFEASFTTSVLRSFAAALHDRFTRPVPATWLGIQRVTLDPGAESQLAQALADLWSLNLRIPSLLGLKAATAERIVDLGRMAAQLHRTAATDVVDERLLLGPLVPQLTLALDTLEALVPQVAGEKWGLLFDELELAPPETRKSLIASMRSVDERLIFKLAIAPYASDLSELVSAVAAMPGHDHEEIWLSYGHKAQAMEFSYELMRALVRDRYGQAVSLESLLGSAVFPLDDEGLESADGVSGTQEEFVRDLHTSDKTFRAYVARVAGGIEELLSSTGQKRSQNLRKVLPLVIVRVAFRTPDNSDAARGSRRTRTRKNPYIYSGMTALSTLLEGNPRWIIGVLSTLFAEMPSRVSSSEQNAEIARTRNAFRAMLSTIPVPNSVDTRRGLLSLINSVGETFRESVIIEPFNPDPVGSFIVDNNASAALIEALGSAVNAGAIVYVPDSAGAGLLSSMKGKRFRLSYLLATQYQLPLRLERSTSLRTILTQSNKQTPLELFTDE